MKNLIIISILFLSGCTRANHNSTIIVHAPSQKNIQLVDIQINKVATEMLIKGNVKYSTRRSRFSRPKGTLFIKIIKPNGDIVFNHSLKLTRKGQMPHYSRFNFLLGKTLVPPKSHLYLHYSYPLK